MFVCNAYIYVLFMYFIYLKNIYKIYMICMTNIKEVQIVVETRGNHYYYSLVQIKTFNSFFLKHSQNISELMVL